MKHVIRCHGVICFHLVDTSHRLAAVAKYTLDQFRIGDVGLDTIEDDLMLVMATMCR